MDLDEIQLTAEDEMDQSVAAFDRDLRGIRTSQANTDLLNGVQVDIAAYGGMVPLKQVAVIARQDMRMLIVKPFDPKTIKDIEKAIMASDLGITPSNDGKIIRLAFPPLTEERRKDLTKHCKELLEKYKVSLRSVRQNALKHVEKIDGQPGISEDALKAVKEEIQKQLKAREAKLDEAFEKKSKEVMTV